MAQRSEHADRVLDLARKEADRFGHRYLGPEHLILGILRDGRSGASRALEASGVDLAAARAAVGQLVDRGVVPRPRPSEPGASPASTKAHRGRGAWSRAPP